MDLTEIVHFDHMQRHPWELARLKVIKEQLEKLLNEGNNQKTVLDIGCGDAYLVGKLSEYFPSTHFIGVDINFTSEQLELFRSQVEKTNLEIHKTLDDVSLAANKVNIVMLLDVIEHIEDEIAFMDSLQGYNYLREDAQFLITVPAFQTLFAAHDVILGHYRRYSNKTLRQRLSQAGYETKKERYFFLSLIPPRLFQVIKEKIIKRDVNIGSDLAAWKGGQLVTTAIKSVLYLDYKIGSFFKALGIKIPGLSNLVVCQRSA